MNTTDLVLIAKDFTDKEEMERINQAITRLLESLRILQSSASRENIEKMEGLKTDLTRVLSMSKSFDYGEARRRISEALGIDSLSGVGAIERIDKAVESPLGTAHTISLIEGVLSERQKKSKTLNGIVRQLDELGVETATEVENFEIALYIPTLEGNSDEIPQILRQLGEFNKLAKALNEITGVGTADVRILRVGSGSLIFYIVAALPAVKLLTSVVKDITSIYKDVLEIKKLTTELKSKGLPTQHFKAITSWSEGDLAAKVEEAAIKEFKKFATADLEPGRRKELEILMKNCSRHIAEQIAKGIALEVIPPKLEKPAILEQPETEENKEERTSNEKAYNEKIAERKTIAENLKTVREVLGLGADIAKLVAPALTNDSLSDTAGESVSREHGVDDVGSVTDRTA